MSQTVSRAIEIMKLIAASPQTLSEVAEHLGVHKSTALRLLQTLDDGGFTRHLPTGKYAIGFAIIPLAQHAIDQIDIRTLAHSYLQRLSKHVGHTVHLAQLLGSDVIYVDKVDGGGTVAMGSRIGLQAELHTSAVAKVVLAYLPGPVRDRLLERVTFRRYTTTTITDRTAFESELELIRQRGWSEDDGEKEPYINCIALPIFNSSGNVTLGMSVTALRAVASLDELREQVEDFRAVAFAISQELGWKGGEHGRA
jgi:DNA-binding IclR family transcriptional regulator